MYFAVLPKSLHATPATSIAQELADLPKSADVGWQAMSQNMPSLNRVLATAALASVIVGLLMSYQWGRAAEPPVAKVIRLHAMISHR